MPKGIWKDPEAQRRHFSELWKRKKGEKNPSLSERNVNRFATMSEADKIAHNKRFTESTKNGTLGVEARRKKKLDALLSM